MIEILVDDRESRAQLIHAIETALAEKAWTAMVSQKRLECGDVQVWINGGLVLIVERKTWADLASSIRDGRIENMHRVCTRAGAVTRIVYLLEGTHPPLLHTQRVGFAHAPATPILHHLAHMALRDRVTLWYSASVAESGWALVLFVDSCRFLDEAFLEALQPAAPENEQELVRFTFFNSLKGIGAATAKALTQLQYPLLDFVEGIVSHDAIAEAPLQGSTRIGNARATKALAALEHDRVWVQLLVAIPGISEATATFLYQQAEVWSDAVLSESVPPCGPSGRKIPERCWQRILQIHNRLV